MKILFILIFTPITALGQNEQNFNKLIEETNYFLNQYAPLSPFENYPLSNLNISDKELKQLAVDVGYAGRWHSQDSIDGDELIFYFQNKIEDRIRQIVSHKDFLNNNIRALIKSRALEIDISDDKKLYNFAFDMKTGGTGCCDISITHFTDFQPKDSIQKAEFDSFFIRGRYDSIYTLKTKNGTKYVLTGTLSTCSSCTQTFVRLISFKNNKFKEDFDFRLDTRLQDAVSYNHETKTVLIDYEIDDLASECSCGYFDHLFDYKELEEKEVVVRCQCKFIFNGSTFKVSEEFLSKKYNKK